MRSSTVKEYTKEAKYNLYGPGLKTILHGAEKNQSSKRISMKIRIRTHNCLHWMILQITEDVIRKCKITIHLYI